MRYLGMFLPSIEQLLRKARLLSIIYKIWDSQEISEQCQLTVFEIGDQGQIRTADTGIFSPRDT